MYVYNCNVCGFIWRQKKLALCELGEVVSITQPIPRGPYKKTKQRCAIAHALVNLQTIVQTPSDENDLLTQSTLSDAEQNYTTRQNDPTYATDGNHAQPNTHLIIDAQVVQTSSDENDLLMQSTANMLSDAQQNDKGMGGDDTDASGQSTIVLSATTNMLSDAPQNDMGGDDVAADNEEVAPAEAEERHTYAEPDLALGPEGQSTVDAHILLDVEESDKSFIPEDDTAFVLSPTTTNMLSNAQQNDNGMVADFGDNHTPFEPEGVAEAPTPKEDACRHHVKDAFIDINETNSKGTHTLRFLPWHINKYRTYRNIKDLKSKKNKTGYAYISIDKRIRSRPRYSVNMPLWCVKRNYRSKSFPNALSAAEHAIAKMTHIVTSFDSKYAMDETTVKSTRCIVTALKTLQEMKNSGDLTDEEFTAAKKKMLHD